MTRHRPYRRPHALHLLLVLVLLPVLVQAQPGSLTGADRDPAAQMPCHTQGDVAAEQAPQSPCAHCLDDAQPHLCPCAQAAPAGLIGAQPVSADRLASPARHRVRPLGPVPDSPDETPFRPPIPDHA